MLLTPTERAAREGAGAFPAAVLKTIFAVGIVFIGTQLYSSDRREEKETLNKKIERESREGHESLLTDSAGTSTDTRSATRIKGECSQRVDYRTNSSMMDVMYADAPYTVIKGAMHIHPTVTELIPTMPGDLSPLE